MYKYMLEKLSAVNDIYDAPGNHLICLEGKKGTGKSSVLREFASKHRDVIQVEAISSNENYLAPIINALHQYFSSIKQRFTAATPYSDFTYEEVVSEQILTICRTSSCAILLYDFVDYSQEFARFIQKLVSPIMRSRNSCSIFVEIDLDNPSYASKIQTIYSIPNQEHLHFDEVEADELKSVFLSENPNLKISEKDLDYIVNSANKNPAMLNIIVNYLKGRNYIALKNGKYSCKPLQTGILANILKEDFLSRFDRLDELMKATFLKSSMFGMEFYVSQLENSFEIIAASELLEQIEECSSLLVQKEITPPAYTFTNSETLHFAESLISEEQKVEWGSILYNYYRKLWEQSACGSSPISETITVRAAFYASVAHKYQEAAAYYAAAVFSYMKRNDYQQALLLLEKIAGLPNKEGLPHIVSMHLIVLKGICLESLGRYEDACCAFRDAVKAYKNTPCFDAQELQYHLAYCTYYTSQVDLALKLAESLKMSLSQNSRADSLYYRVISLLATIYREKADQRFSEMYLLAINECKEHGFEYEYYVQLRKADLCYTEELSIPMLNEAVKYFKAHNYQKEYGKAVHNLGTDHLYLGNSAEAQETLEASKNIFAKIGSVDEVYGINCMGVWYAVIKQDYHQALRLFHEAERMPINDFKKMTIYANIAACYQKLSSPQECEEYIRKCNELPARKRNKDVGFYVRTILLAQAFCDLEQGQSEQSLKTLRSCWGTTLKNDQSYLVARIGLDICMSLNLPPIEEELKFSRISHSRLYETYYQNRCVFHTLRFIE